MKNVLIAICLLVSATAFGQCYPRYEHYQRMDRRGEYSHRERFEQRGFQHHRMREYRENCRRDRW